MSAKWRRSQAWDDAFFPSWAAPFKAILWAFSSIWLAVILLTTVAVYGVLASVPIGLIALIPTWLVYCLAALVPVLLIAGAAVLLARLLFKTGGLRFSFSVLGGLAGGVLGAGLFAAYVWPAISYDPVRETGLQFFHPFVEAYSETTLRRLPGLEMTELEFYSWWPLQLVLVLFVVNMVTATVRRIEFTFKNLGVLTVHTGIVTIALGSVYYQGLKREGDMLLRAGANGPNGMPTTGPPERVYYDNIRTALYISQFRGWQQRPLSGIPRYNDYNLDAAVGETALSVAGIRMPWDDGPDRELSIDVPGPRSEQARALVAPDIGVRVIGYAHYADPQLDYVRLNPSDNPLQGLRDELNPLRVVRMSSRLPDSDIADDFSFVLTPKDPAHRASENQLFSIEYLPQSTSADRWRNLAEPIPGAAPHGLIVEVPGASGQTSFRRVFAAEPGRPITIGDTGYTVEVRELRPEPPFPIVTEGYEGATSSVAIVRVTRTNTDTGEPETYDRYVYSKFPAIDQDILVGQTQADGRPTRRDPEPGLKLTYLDSSRISVKFRDTPTGETQAIVRAPRVEPRVVALETGGAPFGEQRTLEVLRDFVPQLDLWISERWRHADAFQRPVPTPEGDRERNRIGTHEESLLGVELTAGRAGASEPYRRIVWLPFNKYLGIEGFERRLVNFPDGRSVELAFGRRQYPLPGFQLRLEDFEMVAYEHRGAPRDYRSLVRVEPAGNDPALSEPYTHTTQLNAPLTAPFNKRGEDAAGPIGLMRKLVVGMNPNQFKFSQAGWDQSGWNQSQAAADRGEVPRPFARFTILGVGNNPGIYIIALGGVLMSIGIPWAFYIKPWLIRRESAKLRAQHASAAEAKPKKKTADPIPEPEEAGAPA